MAKKVAFAVILSFILSGCTSVLSTRVVQEADDKVTQPLKSLHRKGERD